MSNLQDKVAVVTGASKGIGAGIARALGAAGAAVVVNYASDKAGAEKAVADIKAKGGKAVAVKGDVSKSADVKHLFEETRKAFGKLDVLVNNAAFQVHTHDFLDLTPEHFDLTLKTNLYGYFHMAQAAVPHMKPGSAIVMSGSITGLQGNKGLLDYSTTKGGIHAFARSLATALIPKGIRVNAVAPGPVWTPLNPSDKEPKDIAQFGSQTPMGRPAQPEEIAPAYVFLASPQTSSYITGEVLPIIGGYAGG